MEQMMAFLSLLESGVLERHSSVRFAFLEAGCGWLPYWLYRLDDIEYRHLASEVAEHVRVPPSAYFRRQCFVSFEPGEPYLSDVLARHLFGGRPLVFGTDFPHPDHEADIVDQAVALRKRVPEKVLSDLLWGNASRLYGLS
jgi:predicted TIM-barrel fold metal-dependent hydrolase